ncbi:MAG: sulfatase, partial [Planctomycetales bacterium]|nr:sulfatase [Planctomycetales bacterium]
MSKTNDWTTQLQRRTFLSNAGMGLGAAALSSLLQKDGFAKTRSNSPGATGLPHHAATAKRVIFLCMAGGPSHLE